MPFSKETAINRMMMKTNHYYLNCDTIPIPKYDDLAITHYFPPKYIQEDRNLKGLKSKSLKYNHLPYFYFLTAYYQVIEDFVKSIVHRIDPEEYQILSEHIESYIPDFKKVDKITALSTLLHLVGVIHAVDHEIVYGYFRNYTFMAPVHPFISLGENAKSKDSKVDAGTKNSYYLDKIVNSKNSKVTVQDLIISPQKHLVSKTDILRTRIFYDTFVGFMDTGVLPLSGKPHQSMKLVDTEYFRSDFDETKGSSGHKRDLVLADDPELASAVRKFKHDLKRLDYRLGENLLDGTVKMVPGTSQNFKFPGMRILDIEQFIRSTCY